MLYGILVVQTYFYYLSFPKDKVLLKITVYGLFIIDTFQNVICLDAAWFFLCSGWGRPAALQQFSFGFNLIPPTCGIVSLWVQFFYMYRIYVLGKGHRMWKAVIFVIFLVSVTQAIASLFVVGKLFTFTILSQWHRLEVPIGIWNVGSTIADVLIALSMVFLLSQFRKETIQRGHQTSNQILNRLIRHSIESGAMTALIVIIDTGVIYGLPNTTLFLVFSMMQTKVYTNSLMVSLNARSKLFQNVSNDWESMATSQSRTFPNSRNNTKVHITKQTETFGLSQTGGTMVDIDSATEDIVLHDLNKPRHSLSI